MFPLWLTSSTVPAVALMDCSLFEVTPLWCIEFFKFLREYPDFDGDNLIGNALDTAINGGVPEMFLGIEGLQESIVRADLTREEAIELCKSLELDRNKLIAHVEELHKSYETIEKDAKRYQWLRDPALRRTRRPMNAPFVFNPTSRLYAVGRLIESELDSAVDADILDDMAQYVFENALIDGDERFSDPQFKFSDEFAAECVAKAKLILGE
jgi:hypothetical protein